MHLLSITEKQECGCGPDLVGSHHAAGSLGSIAHHLAKYGVGVMSGKLAILAAELLQRSKGQGIVR